MRLHRVYLDLPLTEHTRLVLPQAASHHIGRVLRMRPGQALQVFDGTGDVYEAEISSIDKHHVEIRTIACLEAGVESALDITLAQGVSRGQHMDLTVQKAVELGVNRIVPLFTERSNVRLQPSRLENKLQHWRKIIIHACEQCGRNRLPEIADPLPLADWLPAPPPGLRLVLSPDGSASLAGQQVTQSGLIIMSGPEGGFSPGEIELSTEHGFLPVRLGPRVLRTETAAIAALSACQTLWGDLG